MMKVDIKFIVGGREVSPDNFGDALSAEFLKLIRDSVEERVGDMRCPEHGTAPQLTAEGDSIESLNWSISGCCEKLTEEVQKAFQ